MRRRIVSAFSFSFYQRTSHFLILFFLIFLIYFILFKIHSISGIFLFDIYIYIPSVTLMAADLRLWGTHLPTTNEISQFVLASPATKQCMLEPLARKGFKKQEKIEIFER